ncbi:MAG: dihydroneopterin aldolase [Bacteroidetes bacterium]|nr:dihydroneopterin aldolase [Bacteroidota bacterium]MDA1119714.1 dihydroneopterin aldolase [Bacteroidota bacterium]
MGKIFLEGMKFHGYHGLHDSERKEGNAFIIDLEIETDFASAGEDDDINQTIDYEEVYRTVKLQMEGSCYLLERLAMKILTSLKKQFPMIQKLTVKVSKLNPPVGGECDRACVELSL